MIDGFTRSRIATNGTTLSVHQAGQGAPLVLLHGYPQTHMTWHRVAPKLAQRFHVIIPDLRGYGDSDIPNGGAEAFSKREMARDIVGLLDALGLPRAHILGHDRGGRVAYRFALDHAERLARLGVVEIATTGDYWANWQAELAMKAYHWTFLAQPAPLPETLISADPVGYIEHTLRAWTLGKSLDVFAPEALASYRAQAADPARIAAMCNDYRAGATLDRDHDDADRANGRQITAPMRFLWAEGGFPATTGDPLSLWQAWAPQVTGQSCVAGHFAMEENPDAVLDTFLPFFLDEGAQ